MEESEGRRKDRTLARRGRQFLWLAVFGGIGVSALTDAVTALLDGRPIRGVVNVAVAVFCGTVVAEGVGWLRLRLAGLIESGTLVSVSGLALTHVILLDDAPLFAVLFFPSLPLTAGVFLGWWYWEVTKPQRLLPAEVAGRVEQLPRAWWGPVQATVVLEDGRQVRNVRVYRGRIASRAATRLFDPEEVVDILPEPPPSKSGVSAESSEG